MSTRTNTTLITRAEFDSSVNKVAELQLRKQQLKVERDSKKEAIPKDYNKQIGDLDLELKIAQTAAQAYAIANRAEMFSKTKSSESALAIFGFRIGQPTLRKITKSKEADIAEQLYKEDHTDLVEAKFSLNKKSIIRAIKESVMALGDLFRVDQKERFFIEAKALKKDM